MWSYLRNSKFEKMKG